MHCGKTTPAPPPGQTNTCENITLPQTSFAGGKNKTAKFSLDPFRPSIHHPLHCIIACSSALTLTRSYLVYSSLLTALLINTSSSRKLEDSLAACSSFVHEFSLDSDAAHRSTYLSCAGILRTIEFSSNAQRSQYWHFCIT